MLLLRRESSSSVCARVELRHDDPRSSSCDGNSGRSRGVRGPRGAQGREVGAARRTPARAHSSSTMTIVARHVGHLAPGVVVVAAVMRHSVVSALEVAVGVGVVLQVGGRGGRCVV